MRITKGQLRQIIREEAQRLHEMPGRPRRSGATSDNDQRAQLHGLRHKQKIQHEQHTFVADTMNSTEWVYLNNADGTPFARQSKYDSGRVYAQGTNPDYEGRLSYTLDRYRNGGWSTYNDQARKGDIKSYEFLDRSLRY